jgi:outer membrane lipoprotein-sorting protein
VIPSPSDTDRGVLPLRLVLVAAALLTVGVVVGMAVQPDGATAPDGETILDRTAERYAEADSFAGTVTVETTFENDTDRIERSASARVQYLAPDSYRIDGRTPDRVANTTAATNGSTAWFDRPTAPPVVRTLNASHAEWHDAANPAEAVERLDSNVSVTNRGTATVDGDETYVLDVEYTGSTEWDERWDDTEWDGEQWQANVSDRLDEVEDANLTVWVDTDDDRLRRVETVVTGSEGTVTTTMRFEAFQFDVAIHESTFQPPTDQQVVSGAFDRTSYETLADADAAVDFGLATPAVPEGFELVNATVGTQGDSATVIGVYTNGTSEFFVVQSEENPLARLDTDGESLAVGDGTVTVVERGDTTVLFWEADGRTYGVAGSLGQDRLAEIAGPMVTAD